MSPTTLSFQDMLHVLRWQYFKLGKWSLIRWTWIYFFHHIVDLYPTRINGCCWLEIRTAIMPCMRLSEDWTINMSAFVTTKHSTLMSITGRPSRAFSFQKKDKELAIAGKEEQDSSLVEQMSILLEMTCYLCPCNWNSLAHQTKVEWNCFFSYWRIYLTGNGFPRKFT